MSSFFWTIQECSLKIRYINERYEENRKKSGVSRLVWDSRWEEGNTDACRGTFGGQCLVYAGALLVGIWSAERAFVVAAQDKLSWIAVMLIHWGWVAFIQSGGRTALLYAGALMASHIAAFRILYGLRKHSSVGHIGRLSLGYLNGTSPERSRLWNRMWKIENLWRTPFPIWSMCL